VINPKDYVSHDDRFNSVVHQFEGFEYAINGRVLVCISGDLGITTDKTSLLVNILQKSIESCGTIPCEIPSFTKKVILCPSCKGTGTDKKCPECEGDGNIDLDHSWMKDGKWKTSTYEAECQSCEGRGEENDGIHCRYCDGKKQITEFDVKQIKVGSQFFDPELLTDLMRYDGFQLFNNESVLGAAYFICEGAKGILMPMREEGY